MEILHKRVPVKNLGSWSDTPWMARDLKRLLRKKKRLYNNYKRSDNPVDKQKYRQYQKHLNGKLRKAEDDFIAVILDIEPNDKPKKFWSYRKAKRQDQIGIPPLMSDTGIKGDSLGKAETLNAQFQQVFTQEDLSYIPNAASCGTAGMDPIIFDVEGIKKLLRTLTAKRQMVQIISLLDSSRILLLKLLK